MSEPSVPITVYFPPETADAINGWLSERRGRDKSTRVTRSDVVRELVDIGLREKARRR